MGNHQPDPHDPGPQGNDELVRIFGIDCATILAIAVATAISAGATLLAITRRTK